MQVGAHVVINDYVHIWAGGGVEIGDDTLIAAHTTITSQSHDVAARSAGLLYRETSVCAPVRIGRNVWIGSAVCILPGVTVGDDAVIGAGAVVTSDIPAASLAVGVPARVVRQL